jgi:NADH-quinone oxidoreductase subunit E
MKDKVAGIIKKYGGDPSQMVSILQDIQAEYNYLPRAALDKLSKKMAIPQSHIYSMATFFRAFSLEERGKHIVSVCTSWLSSTARPPPTADSRWRRLTAWVAAPRDPWSRSVKSFSGI